MKTVSQVQQHIFNTTGLKTSVKKLTGSMKGYISIRPIYQNGNYPSFPFDFVTGLKPLLKEFSSNANPVFCAIHSIDIFNIENDAVRYKREIKPKPIDESKPMKGWGSKNSQLRLDKATARNAVKMKKGNTARHY